jgi:hypothetical protein
MGKPHCRAVRFVCDDGPLEGFLCLSLMHIASPVAISCSDLGQYPMYQSRTSELCNC